MRKNIVILTGAGISAESGIATFRASDGLWENHPIDEVATPEGFERNPELVHEFYNQRRITAQKASPNKAHEAIEILAKHHNVTLITQNVDDLHEKAGSFALHMHGSLFSMSCTHCEHIWAFKDMSHPSDLCPHCQTTNTRPDIVWFGEMPKYMEEISSKLENCDIFLSIGTSGAVYPAAGFAQIANRNGARCLEFNLEEANNARDFHEHIYGKASETISKWVDEIIHHKD